jgi:ADP-ribose pyrophosphatase
MERKIQTIASLRTRHIEVDLDEVLLKNGRTTRRIRIDHPPAAALVPFITDESILMVRQFRYALGRETLEIPAGKLEPGEEPQAGIRRELREETGYEAGRIELLYTFAPAIGYSNELIHVFRGRELRKTTEQSDEDEISKVEIISVAELRELILAGRIQDGKTLLGLALTGVLLGSK